MMIRHKASGFFGTRITPGHQLSSPIIVVPVILLLIRCRRSVKATARSAPQAVVLLTSRARRTATHGTPT
jgi:hypothetical protein